MPRSPQEQMAMTPEVFKFTRNFGRGAPTRQEPSVIQQVAGDLGKLALLGAVGGTAHGLGQILSTENNISPVSEAVMSAVGEPEPRRQRNPVYTKENYGNPVPDPTSDPNFYSEVASHDFGSPTGDGFVEPTVRIPVRREEPAPTTRTQRTTVLPEGNYGNQKIDPAIEAKYSIARNEAPLYLANRFEKMANIGEAQADLAYEESGQAALDQAFEDAVARDDMREERTVTALAEGPETVIEPTKSTTGFLNEFSKEVQDFDHNIPWKERTEEALESDSALEAAKIITKTVAEKGFKDVGTRAKKIVRQVPKTIEKVKEGIQEAANVITHEQIKASTYAEAARISAGLPPLLGSDVVEVGIESDLSDNAQFDDPHQTNEQMSPAGLNRQDTTQTVIDLSNTLSKGLAHLSPEDRMDLARKMIDSGYNS